jgi:hypothetical protein
MQCSGNSFASRSGIDAAQSSLEHKGGESNGRREKLRTPFASFAFSASFVFQNLRTPVTLDTNVLPAPPLL